MLLLSCCETMLNSIEGKENIKTDYMGFFFIPEQRCNVCVGGGIPNSHISVKSRFPSNWETNPNKKKKHEVPCEPFTLRAEMPTASSSERSPSSGVLKQYRRGPVQAADKQSLGTALPCNTMLPHAPSSPACQSCICFLRWVQASFHYSHRSLPQPA